MMRLIDADALINTLNKEKIEFNADINYFILNAPTIDAEPVRHGRWQVYEAFGVKDMTCSVCGWLYEYYAGAEEELNFCSHCGAKMDEED